MISSYYNQGIKNVCFVNRAKEGAVMLIFPKVVRLGHVLPCERKRSGNAT